MNEEEYRSLCDACDRVLLAPSSSIERVAIAWLHVLNEHPSNLGKYVDLFGGKRAGVLAGIKSMLRTVLDVRKWLKSCSPWYSSSSIPTRSDVIIVSHLLNESQAGAEDFYFGGLPEALQKNGLSNVVVLRDHTGLDRPDLSSKWPSTMAPRLLLPGTLTWREELVLRQRLRRESSRLRQEADESESALQQRVLNRAAQQAGSYASIGTLRFYCQIASLVERLLPNQIIVTYEGHAWERLAFAAARSVIPEIRCIGYHHAILFPRQHAIKRLLGTVFDPTAVVMGGDITRDVLAQSKGLRRIRVTTVGTHRQEEPSVPLAVKVAQNAIPACLVIPDGTVDECLTIFNFVLAAANLVPTLHFVLRMHPVLSFTALTKLDRRLASLPKNVEVSRQSINADFDRCRWALYRGSGAAIRAVVAGLRPFYLALPNELDIDPLYRIGGWRCVVSVPKDIAARVNLDLQSDVASLDAELDGAREFCQKYFRPVDLQKFYNEIVGSSEIENGDVLVNR